MGLEFTTIPDRDGPAVYLIGNRSHERTLTELGQEIDAITPEETQTVYLDIKSGNGAQVASFYGYTLEQLPVVMVVQDDDTLYHVWHGVNLPAADVVAHHLSRVNGSLGA